MNIPPGEGETNDLPLSSSPQEETVLLHNQSHVTPEDLHTMVVEWNATQHAYPQQFSLHTLFETQVERTPDAIALFYEQEQITYIELDRRTNRLAHLLQSQGVEPEVRVGICINRSIEMVIGLLAILKAGGTYVPLDPTYPVPRLEYVLADSEVRLILTHKEVLPQLLTLVTQLEQPPQAIGCLDPSPVPAGLPSTTRFWDISTLASCPDTRCQVYSSVHIAYIMYTSGSTGLPKGVSIAHYSLVSFFFWTQSFFHFSSESRVIQYHSLSFDFSVWEIFEALLSGASLCLVPAETARDISALTDALSLWAITVLNMTPSQFTILLDYLRQDSLEAPATLRTVILGGEALSVDLARRAAYALPATCQIFNEYGPTETTISCSIFPINRQEILDDEHFTMSIGRPLYNTQLYVLDPDLRPVPVGVRGELYIGGVQLAPGYLHRPELTAERFLPDPFSQQAGSRLYKSGDMVRYLPGGTIEYLERVDQQVKLRGYRIELEEIQTVLQQHPDIQQALVIVREDVPGDKRLVAYVIESPKQSSLLNQWRDFVQARLPTYMVPTALVVLERWPLTTHGKLDRQALPVPERDTLARTDQYVPARTATERLVKTIWGRVLGREQISVYDNFFMLGGHSLLASQVIAELRSALAIPIPLSLLFKTATLEDCALALDALRASEEVYEPFYIPRVVRAGFHPVSFPQEQVWFQQQLNPDNRAYAFQATLRFTGILHTAALEQSLNEIIRRHEIFRTTFETVDGQPMQVIHDTYAFQLPVIDLRSLPEAQREEAVQHLLHEEFQKPFDITCLPLMRWILLQIDEQVSLLVHVEHHFAHDGWSFYLFLRDLFTLYRAFSEGNPSPLPDLPIQFVDFVTWHKNWMQGEVLEHQLAYWKRTLATSPAQLPLPIDHPRPPVQHFQGSSIRVSYPLDFYALLRDFSSQRRVTLFMTMFAAFLTLLSRYTQQEDLCVASGVADRGWKESQDVIGMLVNIIVLRTDLSGNPSFEQLLQRVREVTANAYTYQNTPFGKVVAALQPQRDLSYNPFSQVMFSFHDSPAPDLSLPGMLVELTQTLSNNTAKSDLNVIVATPLQPQSGQKQTVPSAGFTMIWEYNTDLFERATIERMIGHYRTLLEAILFDSTRHLSDLPLLTNREHQSIAAWNATQRTFAYEATIQGLFEAQVEHTPDLPAVVFEQQSFTYRELNQRANQLAWYLQQQGVGPDVLVGVCMQRSPEMVIALLAVLKAGGAYVPLDPGQPHKRLTAMLASTPMPVLLTHTAILLHLPSLKLTTLCLDTFWNAERAEPETNLEVAVEPTNLAYMIYTSGSTGEPKGVLIQHKSVTNLLHWHVTTFALSAQDHASQFARFSFDAAGWELWPYLVAGACVHFVPDALLTDLHLLQEWLIAHAITICFLPPALAEYLLTLEWSTPLALRILLVGGDVFHCYSPSSLPFTIINNYGPTESTVVATSGNVPNIAQGTVLPTIGRPIDNTHIYILDQHLHQVPVGVPGELHIGGCGLARGYLNAPELTAQKFIAHPFSEEPGARLYKSGDMARYLPDGSIEFLGRNDYQIKVRGFRIEPGEIEAALCQYPTVRQAFVVARDDASLLAYIVLREHTEFVPQDLRAYLQTMLPEYMIPALFIPLHTFPYTPNGKIDRLQLPDPSALAHDQAQDFIAPRTALERQLATIWEEVLGKTSIGVQDNFFDAGGHSLLAIQVISRIRKLLSIEMPVSDLFEAGTIEYLAIRAARLQNQQLQESPEHTPAPQKRSVGQLQERINQLSEEETSILLDHLLKEVGQ